MRGVGRQHLPGRDRDGKSLRIHIPLPPPVQGLGVTWGKSCGYSLDGCKNREKRANSHRAWLNQPSQPGSELPQIPVPCEQSLAPAVKVIPARGTHRRCHHPPKASPGVTSRDLLAAPLPLQPPEGGSALLSTDLLPPNYTEAIWPPSLPSVQGAHPRSAGRSWELAGMRMRMRELRDARAGVG